MKNYTITKDQIVELSGYGITHILKRMIPDAFKKEFTTGKWYKIDKNIFCCTEIDERGSLYGYGLFDGIWKERFNDGSHYCACNEASAENRLVEATPQEVETALIAEAKKKFKVGDKIQRPFAETLDDVFIDLDTFFNDPEYYYSKTEDYLEFHGFVVYHEGNWAQIIPQEKQVIPMEKALKIIAKKLKTSPDNIEIK